MRSATHATFGNPAEVITVTETDTPVPETGEVLVRTILSAIHNHDLWTVRGEYGVKPDLPATGGTEAVGVIEAVGPQVDSALVGKRVTVAGTMGTWADYLTAPAASVLPLPDAVSDEDAAQLVAMPFSAISLLEFAKAKAGDWVVQTAANGAVGKIIDALAKTRGIHVVNIVRRQTAAEELRASGVQNVVSTDQSDWKDQAKSIIGEQGAQIAIDSVGGSTANDLVDLLGWEGLLVTFGTADGGDMILNSGQLIFKHITVKGFWGAKVSQHMAPETRKALISELVTLAAQGKLPLDVDAIFDLSDAPAAMQAAQTPGRKGKVLLRA